MPLNASIWEGEASLHSDPSDYIEILTQKKKNQNFPRDAKGRASCDMMVKAHRMILYPHVTLPCDPRLSRQPHEKTMRM
jgi:hypothetical protein